MAKRALVPFEIAAIATIAIAWPRVSWSDLIPWSLPVLGVALISFALRRHPWDERREAPPNVALIGAIAGAVALAIALVVATPLVETVTSHAVEWSQYGFVRGNAMQVIVFAMFVGFAAFAAEVALRVWIVERALELGANRVLAVVVAAIAETMLTPGPIFARIGAATFGVGLGWLYLAGGLRASLSARIAFSVGALLLDGLRII